MRKDIPERDEEFERVTSSQLWTDEKMKRSNVGRYGLNKYPLSCINRA